MALLTVIFLPVAALYCSAAAVTLSFTAGFNCSKLLLLPEEPVNARDLSVAAAAEGAAAEGADGAAAAAGAAGAAGDVGAAADDLVDQLHYLRASQDLPHLAVDSY